METQTGLKEKLQMVDISVYRGFKNMSSQKEVVEEFHRTLIDTNRTPRFFVDWEKVKSNIERYNIEINILNSLIGATNIKEELKNIFAKYPEVRPVIPLIIAVRDLNIKVIEDFETSNGVIANYNFGRKRSLSSAEIEEIINFCEKASILSLFENGNLKSLRDYLLGVEVGLDTNARKNRSGSAMEIILTPILEQICHTSEDFELVKQRKFKDIARRYNCTVPAGLRERKFDFIIKKGQKFINIEVNFYSGTGSKPQEIVDSYINRQRELTKNNWSFIWVTDGDGWRRQVNQITKGFEEISYVLNLHFVRTGLLRKIIDTI